MTDERDDEVFERRLAAALREERGERVPDVTAAVLARVAAGEVVEVGTAAPVRSRLAWLAAAAVFLLGIATVFAVAWSQRSVGDGGSANGGDGGSQVAQQPEQTKLLEVTRIGDIATLPRDLKAVELRNLEDDAVAALVARCPDLERLRLYASTSGWRNGDLPAQSITDAALEAVARLRRLRQLELNGVVLVQGPGLRHLEGLPLLEQLSLDYMDLDDVALAFLERLPALRHLQILLNQAMGNDAWATIGRCTGLRTLRIRGGKGIDDDSLVPLGKLTHLEVLELDSINGSTRGYGDEDARRRFPRNPDPKLQPGRGVHVGRLPHLPKLRILSLERALELEPSIDAVLSTRFPQLQSLDVRECEQLDDRTIRGLLRLPKLVSLSIGRCPRLTQAIIADLANAPRLTHIDFGVTPWFTVDHARTLVAAGKDVQCLGNPDQTLQRDIAMLRNRPVRSLAEIEALPKTTTRIELRGLGDRAAAMLARFPELCQVAFVRDDDDAFTVEGLTAVAVLPKLVQLELNNLPNLRAGDLAALRTARSLRSLDVVGVAVDDSALQVMPELPDLDTLLLSGVRTFGDEGARAIGRCRNLQRLEVPGCEPLTCDAIAAFGTLTRLETLNLRDLPSLSDSALMGLQKLTKLRALHLGPGRFTSMGMQALAGMRELKILQLSGNRELVTSALLLLPTSLETLQLDECPGIGDDAGTLLRDRFPQLRSLDLGGNKNITDATLAAILQNPSLQRLGVRDCSALTTASFAAIRDARHLRELDATRAPCLTDATAAELQRLRPELKITRKVW